MKLHLSLFVAALALGAPLAGHASMAEAHDSPVPVHASDEMPTAQQKAPVAAPASNAGMAVAPGASWIESGMARDWWKDN